MPTTPSLADVLLQLLEARALSPEDAANLAGVSSATMSRALRGHPIKAGTLGLIVRSLARFQPFDTHEFQSVLSTTKIRVVAETDPVPGNIHRPTPGVVPIQSASAMLSATVRTAVNAMVDARGHVAVLSALEDLAAKWRIRLPHQAQPPATAAIPLVPSVPSVPSSDRSITPAAPPGSVKLRHDDGTVEYVPTPVTPTSAQPAARPSRTQQPQHGQPAAPIPKRRAAGGGGR